MANRIMNKIQALDTHIKVVAGSFLPNGSGVIDNSSNTGDIGWSVARASAGTFTVTLEDKYKELVAGVAQVALASAADMAAQLGAVDVSSAGTVSIRTQAGGTATDISSDEDNRVHFMLLLKNMG